MFGPWPQPEPIDELERLLEANEWKWEVWKNDPQSGEVPYGCAGLSEEEN
jgi:hypothetical protein